MWQSILAGGAVGGSVLGQYLNYENQKDALEWQKDIQQTIFNREDTSIQRRVADLQAAGLSPVLAAGQGAGTGGTVQINPPQLNLSGAEQMAFNLMRMEADISATRSQEEYTKTQTYNAGQLLPAQLAEIEARIKNADAQTYKTYQDAKKARVEAANMEKTGTSGSNIFSQAFRDLIGASSKVVNNTKKQQEAKSKNEPVKKPIIDLKNQSLYPNMGF